MLPEETLTDMPVLIGATGGTERHSLVLEHALRPLFSYLRAIVSPTGVYAATDDFGASSDEGTLDDRVDGPPESSGMHRRESDLASRIRIEAAERPVRPREERGMPQEPGKIRNVAVVGHRGTGKTSLVEAMLFQAGKINRLGTVEAGTTVSDWDEDEQKRQMSLAASLAHARVAGPQDQPDRHARRLGLPGRHDRERCASSRARSSSSPA